MNIFINISLGAAFFLSVSEITSAEEPSSLLTVEALLAKQDYAGAKTVLDEYCKTAQSDNKALYLRVAIDQTEMLDYESYSISGERFTAMADSVRKVLEGRLPKLSGRDSVACLLYIANIYGGIGVVKAKTGRLLSSAKSSLASVRLFKDVLRRDSTMYSASLGIGAFHYYLCKTFKWLPFVDDGSENEGIREVEMATRSPFPFDFAAKNTLCWMLMERKQFARADSVARSTLAEVPGNTLFLRIRCLAALWGGRDSEAIAFGENLAETSLKRTPINWSDLVMAYYAICYGNDALGRKQEASASADYIFTRGIPAEYRIAPPVMKNLNRLSVIRGKR